MKLSLKLIPLLFALILISCGEKQDKNKPVYAKKTVKKVVKTPPSVRVDLKNKGFDFQLFTSIYKTKTGNTYYYIYDQGYLALENELFLLIKREI